MTAGYCPLRTLAHATGRCGSRRSIQTEVERNPTGLMGARTGADQRDQRDFPLTRKEELGRFTCQVFPSRSDGRAQWDPKAATEVAAGWGAVDCELHPGRPPLLSLTGILSTLRLHAAALQHAWAELRRACSSLAAQIPGSESILNRGRRTGNKQPNLERGAAVRSHRRKKEET
jgi:hypothetical protein